jgi:rubrerythrin
MDKIKMIDFLTDKIFEESKDASSYMEHAASCSDATVTSTLNKIAEEELGH